MGRRIGTTRVAVAAFLASCGVAAAQTVTPPPATAPAAFPPAAPPAWVEQSPAGEIVPARYGEPATGTTPNPFDEGAGRYNPAGQTQPTANPQPLTPSRATGGTPATRPQPQRTTPSRDLTPVGAPRVERASVSKGSGRLPNDAGQVWREYDIRPYTQRVSGEAKPQQRVVDWILRETGYEAWHSETFGILNADRDKLTVYHTPAMQSIVTDIVDRFVNSRASDRAFSMRILTVRNPDWRVKALGLMTPISVQSPGLQGWIMPKENHALLMAEFSRRSDVRDYNAAGQLVPNGRAVVFSTMRPRGYVKGIIPTAQTWPGYQPEMGQLDEGASLEFNPLLSINLDSADAVIKLRMNQVEKMRQVSLDLPASPVAGGSGGQRIKVEVPQITMANLNERFRWPADQVLLLSMGMVATPGPESGGTFTDMLPGMMKSPPRADALLFVQAQNSTIPTAGPAPAGTPGRVSTAARSTPTFHGRY